MIKTPLSTVIGGAFWTPGATVIGGNTPTFDQQILKLFANGEQGFFYDPNDLTTLYQDAAGTVPVTDVGQAVGLIHDKSGRNNHAYQTSSASRPILRQNAVTGANYLEFDNVDDYLQISNAALPSPMSTMFAVDSSVDGYSILLSAGSAGYINLTTTGIGLDGPNGLGTTLTRNVPKDVVSYKFANSSVNMKTATGEATISSGNSFSTSSIKYIGRFSPTGAAKFGGNIYGIVVITKELSTAEESTLRQLFNKRLGV